MSKKIMKRSLALGALMAFVITGQALAADNLFGGEDLSYATKLPEKITFELEQTTGSFDEVISGTYIGINTSTTHLHDQTQTIDFKETSTVLGGDIEAAEGVYAGSKIAVGYPDGGNHPKVTLTLNTNKTNLTINGGSYGTTTTDDGFRKILSAGDFIKDRGTNYGNVVSITSNVKDANLTINDGDFESVIFGGSVIGFYTYDLVQLEANVEKTTVNINGGTYESPVVAGGGVYNTWSANSNDKTADREKFAKSNVGEAYLNIGNKVTVGDVYAGGLEGVNKGASNLSTEPIATVEKSFINLNDATVSNVYGYGVNAYRENGTWSYSVDKDDVVNTDLTLINATVTGTVDVAQGSVTLSAIGDGETKVQTLKVGEDVKVSMVGESAKTDNLKGEAEAFVEKITITNLDGIEYSDIEGKMSAGEVIGDVTFKLTEDGKVVDGSVKEAVNTVNQSIGEAAVNFKAHYRAHMNDMNKRMGELRMANGETGVWTRMVRGENEFEGAKSQYNQYQLGYDEKLSVDKRWTVGAAVTFAEGNGHFAQGSNEDDSTAFAIYGSKLNNDGTFVDLIARYAHLESDLTIGKDKADYSTNGYSVSAEFGKRIQQGNGMWIEPQVELIYGSIDSAEYKVGNKAVQVGDMDSLIGRVGFRIGKDIEAGNVYARASYLYDFDGETENTFTASGLTRTIEEDLGGGWFEVGVGANINLSKATYIYADIEKTFGGEIDTNWQWNLGVRYSF